MLSLLQTEYLEHPMTSRIPRIPHPQGSLVLGLMLAALLASTARAGDWPGFLGPLRNGISSETGLLDTFPSTGPKVAWRVAAGVGMSGLAVADGRVVTMVESAGQQQVWALDLATGKVLWKSSVSRAYRNGMGNGARATPMIAGDTVVAFTGEGLLVVMEAKTGAVRWSRNVVKSLKGQVADYGMACSPLVVGEMVVVTPGAPGAAVAAFGLQDGTQIWTAADGPAGYSSPALIKAGGRLQVVAFLGDKAVGLDPDRGTPIWNYPYKTDYDCNIATPLLHKGHVFLSSGENHGSVMLELKKTGTGLAPSVAWQTQGPGADMRNEWQTSILLGGFLYGMDNVGGAGPITHLGCLNATTGKLAWKKTRFGKGNLIAADGKLWISTLRGELVLVAASPKGFRELARAEVLGPTRQAPSLAHGKLLIRDDAEIVCLDIKKPAAR
jgi:outer membrane protein assembly factor BamB